MFKKSNMILMFSLLLCGCSNISSDLSSNSSSIGNECPTSGCIEGGPGSLIYGKYYFYNGFDEYLEFYEIFKQYNIERYLQPIDDNSTMTYQYRFTTCPIVWEYVRDRKYDLDFQDPHMYVKINTNLNDFELEGECMEVYETYELSDIRMEFEKTKYELFINLFCAEKIIFKGKITSSLSESEINEICLAIVEEFKGGIQYIF